jgi:hypothetical protein
MHTPRCINFAEEREKASMLGRKERDSIKGRIRVSTPRRERGRFGKASIVRKEKVGDLVEGRVYKEREGESLDAKGRKERRFDGGEKE